MKNIFLLVISLFFVSACNGSSDNAELDEDSSILMFSLEPASGSLPVTRVQFTVPDGVTTECSLNETEFVACTSPLIYDFLLDGDYELVINAIDSEGLVLESRSFSFTIDESAVGVNIDSSPQAFSNQPDGNIEFSVLSSANDFLSSECSLDEGAYEECVSPFSYTGLTEGSHQFKVRAVDTFGNTTSSVISNWLIDLTDPMITFFNEPGDGACKEMGMGRADFFIYSTQTEDSNLKSIECSFNGSNFAGCSSALLTEGITIRQLVPLDEAQSFTVEVEDMAGNTAMETRTFTISSTISECPIVVLPEG